MATDCDNPTTKLPDWVIQVDEKLSKMESFQPKQEMQRNGKPCIYRVPYGVLRGIGENNKVCEILEDCIARLFNMRHVSIRYDQNNKCKHILEVYRKGLVDQVIFKSKKGCNPYGSRETRTAGGFPSFRDFNIPSATQLDKAGIGFTASDTTSLMDISFRLQTLSLPQVVVDRAMGSSYFNIILFEKLHKDAGNEVTSYIYFMRCLIQEANDVSLLQSRGIISSTLSIEEVFSMFHRLFQDIPHGPDDSLIYVHWNVGRMLRRRFNKMTNEWQADLFQKYLRSPWAILSVIAAILLFALTIIQTVYTVLSYVNRK